MPADPCPMPDFCPRCLANFTNGSAGIALGGTPKCSRCGGEIVWADRMGVIPNRVWPSVELIVAVRNVHFKGVAHTVDCSCADCAVLRKYVIAGIL